MTHPGTRLEQLLDILQMLRDGSAFYAAAAGDADEPLERDLLRTLADTKTLMARDVVTLVPVRDADQARDGDDIHHLRESYLRCRAALRARRSTEFTRALQAAERRVLDVLWDALCAAKDPSVQHVLERQYGRAVQAHERLRDMQHSIALAQLSAGRSAAA